MLVPSNRQPKTEGTGAWAFGEFPFAGAAPFEGYPPRALCNSRRRRNGRRPLYAVRRRIGFQAVEGDAPFQNYSYGFTRLENDHLKLSCAR
jgi:hypothetical protein